MSDEPRRIWTLNPDGSQCFPNGTKRGEAPEPAEGAAEKLRKLLPAAVEVARERAGYADTMVAALRRQIDPLNKELKPDEEIGALLTTFGASVFIRVDTIIHEDPHLIIIRGVDEEDESVSLFQHVSQVNILFKIVKVKPGKEARRIGFV